MKRRKLIGSYLIVVEGESEQLYFEGLKSRLPREYARQVNIKIEKAKPGDALTFVRSAIKKKRLLDIANVYVVFDYDNFKNIDKAFELARKNDIKVIFSKVCFELWLLLHFEYTTASFNKCDDLIKNRLNKYIDYAKAGDYDAFYSNLHQALKNTQRLRNWIQENYTNAPLWSLPTYTNIDLLVKEVFSKVMDAEEK